MAQRKTGLSWAETAAYLGALHGLLRVRRLTEATHDAGLGLAARYGLSVHDAMIVAAQDNGGSDEFAQEDVAVMREDGGDAGADFAADDRGVADGDAWDIGDGVSLPRRQVAAGQAEIARACGVFLAMAAAR